MYLSGVSAVKHVGAYFTSELTPLWHADDAVTGEPDPDSVTEIMPSLVTLLQTNRILSRVAAIVTNDMF